MRRVRRRYSTYPTMRRPSRPRPRLTLRGLFRAARSGSFVVLLIAALTGAVVGAGQLYRNFAKRTIAVCAATDVSFRLQRPDWEYRLKLWITEVNRIFEPAGLQWEVASMMEAYPEETAGTLKERA